MAVKEISKDKSKQLFLLEPPKPPIKPPPPSPPQPPPPEPPIKPPPSELPIEV